MSQDGDDEEDITFNVEDVQKIVRDTIELVLGGNAYSHSRTPQWIALISDKALTRLNKLNKPFKYISSYALEGKCREARVPGNIRRLRATFPDTATVPLLMWSVDGVRITVTQRNGAALHTAAAYYWDTAADGACCVRWENKYMYCVVNVWALALLI